MVQSKIISVNELWEFLNLSSSLFFIIGTDGYFKYINPAVTQLLGFSEELLLSKPCIKFIHPDDVTNNKEKTTHVQDGRELLYFSNRYITVQGTYKLLNWTVTTPTDDGYIYAIAQDCTPKAHNKIEGVLQNNINQLLAMAHLFQEAASHDENNRQAYINKTLQLLDNTVQRMENLFDALLGVKRNDVELDEAVRDLIAILHCKK